MRQLKRTKIVHIVYYVVLSYGALQIKLKQNNIKAKAKAIEKQKQKLTNSLTYVKSELVVSYFNFPCKQLIFVAKPSILAASEK